MPNPGLAVIASAPEKTPQREMIGGLSVLHWRGTSRRTPLLLLHGIGSNANSWRPLAGALAFEGDILAWDAPGYGESPALAHQGLDGYADAVARLLLACGYQKAIVFGHSLGALIAARFAVIYPQNILALGLLSPALGYGVAPGDPLPAHVQARIDDLDRMGPRDFAAARAARLVYDAENQTDLVERIHEAMAGIRQPGYGHAVHALAEGQLLSDAPLILAPTIVAAGAEDRVTPPAGARAIYARLPNPRGFFEIGEAGHALPQQKPDETARLLKTFLGAIRHDS